MKWAGGLITLAVMCSASPLVAQKLNGLPVNLTLRLGVIPTPAFAPACKYRHVSYGVEIRSKQKWFGSIAYDRVVGAGADVLCTGALKSFADGSYAVGEQGFELDDSHSVQLGVGRVIGATSLAAAEIALTAAGLVADSPAGRLHPWFGVDLRLTFLRDHLVASYRHGWARYPVHYTIYQPRAAPQQPAIVGTEVEKHWGALSFGSLGLRF